MGKSDRNIPPELPNKIRDEDSPPSSSASSTKMSKKSKGASVGSDHFEEVVDLVSIFWLQRQANRVHKAPFSLAGVLVFVILWQPGVKGCLESGTRI